jgi:hypothetical protein
MSGRHISLVFEMQKRRHARTPYAQKVRVVRVV